MKHLVLLSLLSTQVFAQQAPQPTQEQQQINALQSMLQREQQCTDAYKAVLELNARLQQAQQQISELQAKVPAAPAAAPKK